MTLWTRWLSFLGAGAFTAGLAAVSRLPYPPTAPAHAVIRLAWRAPGQRIEECRRLTPAELEKLPVHMRREQVCEERILPYQLQVRVDDSLLVDRSVRAAGAQQDRPLYVYHEVKVYPGKHRLTVKFFRQPGTVKLGGNIKGDFPEELVLERNITLPRGGGVLVTYDPHLRSFVLRAPAAQGTGSEP